MPPLRIGWRPDGDLASGRIGCESVTSRLATAESRQMFQRLWETELAAADWGGCVCDPLQTQQVENLVLQLASKLDYT